MLTMFDAVYPQNLPAGGDAYLGYVGGSWPTFTGWTDSAGHVYAPLAQQPVARGKSLLSMAVEASFQAEGLDVERYDATPQQAPAWTKQAFIRGVYRPVLYTSQSNLGTLMSYLTGAGIARPSVRLLSAHYDNGWVHLCGPGTCGAPVDVDGTQWQSTNTYDQSTLLDNFFAAAPTPSPTPNPAPAILGTKEKDMTVVRSTAPNMPSFGVIGAFAFPLGDQHDLNQLQAGGAAVVYLDPASFTAFRDKAHV